ncbi:MAG: type IV toxin-antitoxin system AbiEi family antitoxin [Gaiellaceae bacterium]
MVIEVEVGVTRHRLVAIWAGNGWPSDVAGLGSADAPWPRDEVVTARRFSRAAIERLEAMRANWADETGRAHIESTSGLLVLREMERPSRHSPTAFRWSASAASIAEYLLAEPARSLRVSDLAKQSGWSHAQVSNVLQHFDKQGWTEKSGTSRGPSTKRRLAEPAALLDAWADFIASSKRTRVLAHRNVPDLMSFLRQDLTRAFAQREIGWATSGWAGLELAAPFATSVPVLHIYVADTALLDGRLHEVMAELQLREVEEGARVEFLASERGPLSLASERNGLYVVSPPRLYADLRALGGRAEDAADHAREVLIGF